MKKQLNYYLLGISIFMLLCPVTIAQPRKKTIKTKYPGDVLLEYVGVVDNKIPNGEGTLFIKKNGEIIDQVSGFFNNSHVSNAQLSLYKSPIYNGTLDYYPTNEGITYTLIDGSIEFDVRSSVDRHEIVPVKPRFEIHREWESLMITPGVLQSKIKRQFESNDYVSRKYISFVGSEPILRDVKECVFDFNRKWVKYYVNGTPNSGRWESKPQYYEMDFGDKGYGYYDGDTHLFLANGDSLMTSNSGDVFHLYKHINGGVLECHFTTGRNFEHSAVNNHWVARNSPLMETVLQNMPIEYNSILDSIRMFSVYDRITDLVRKEIIPFDDKRVEYEDLAVEVEYSNGDTYIGSLYFPDGKVNELLMSRQALPNEDDYYFGLFTRSTGERQYYIMGYPAETIYQQFRNAVEAERIKKEQETRDYLEQRASLVKEYSDNREKLTKKYGKKYVDAIYDENTILVGTPEALLKEKYSLFVNSETSSFIVYDVYYASTIRSFVVWIDKSTHRVTRVNNYK